MPDGLVDANTVKVGNEVGVTDMLGVGVKLDMLGVKLGALGDRGIDGLNNEDGALDGLGVGVLDTLIDVLDDGVGVACKS